MNAQPLLELLTDQPQSAADLAQALDVAPETVQEWAAELVAEAVPLEATGVGENLGYALRTGTPAPRLVRVQGTLGKRLRYAGTVGSTQDEIRRWADDPLDPAPHGAVCVAERQTLGRGRRGRSWETTHGTLVFSMLLGGERSPAQVKLAQVTLWPLAVGVALRGATGVGGLKWPNDLLAPGGRKLAGILLEADLRGNEVRRAVLGIGVNVSAAPPGAACLHEWRPELTRAEVLSSILAALEHWLTAPPEEILQAWREQSFTLGQAVKVQTAAGQIAGVALDIDTEGSLLVQDAAGQLHTVHAGDVELVGRW